MRIESLIRWIKATPDEELRRKCKEARISPAYLMQIAYGHKRALKSAAGIEAMTCSAVTRRELRPDDWERIWPELIRADIGATPDASVGGSHA